ncbi:MAG: hypothetical protein Q7R33_01975 [Nitrosarchaeum sp.]|nr:hypothetical protein [Nitrosarchaeum sp.]
MNEKINEALTALKSLESYGYKERAVTIDKIKIVLAPLTAGEIVEVFEASNKYDDVDASTQSLKIETLVRAIIAVNDVKFDPKGHLVEKKSIVSSFGDELVDILFSEYCLLDKTVKDNIDKREATHSTGGEV